VNAKSLLRQPLATGAHAGPAVWVQPGGNEALAGRGHPPVVESDGPAGCDVLQRLLPRALGAPRAMEEEIAGTRANLGTMRRRSSLCCPPPSGGRSFTAYASRSTTGPTIQGPESSVVQSSLLTIDQQLITQQYTSQTTAGARLSFPLPAWKGIQSSWSIGVDYKEDKVVTLPTNNFYYTTVVGHGAGSRQRPPRTPSR